MSEDQDKMDNNDGVDFSSLFDDIKNLDKTGVDSTAEKVAVVPEKNKERETSTTSGNGSPADLLYRKGLLLAEKIFVDETVISLQKTETVKHWTTEVIKMIEGGDQELIECVFDASYRNSMDYVVLNVVNVSILSLELGSALGYKEASLLKLGVAAFLHDVGMRDYKDVIEESRELEFAEKNQMHQHPIDGSLLLRTLKDEFVSAVADIVEQEHERVDGSGYPRGLQGDNISEYAQIIGFVDVYEALTHPRPYRKSFTPLGAVKVIIERDNAFEPKLIKAFLERVGLYPKGVFVELNTREIALVLIQNKRMPSCPIVKVIYNNKGEKTGQRRKIDLSKGTRIYIVRSI